MLIQSGAEVNARDRKGGTPLHLACEKGKLPTVEALLHDQRTDRNITDYFCQPALIRAIFAGQTEVVTHLIKAGPPTTLAILNLPALADTFVFGTIWVRLRLFNVSSDNWRRARQDMQDYCNYRGKAVWRDEEVLRPLLQPFVNLKGFASLEDAVRAWRE